VPHGAFCSAVPHTKPLRRAPHEATAPCPTRSHCAVHHTKPLRRAPPTPLHRVAPKLSKSFYFVRRAPPKPLRRVPRKAIAPPCATKPLRRASPCRYRQKSTRSGYLPLHEGPAVPHGAFFAPCTTRSHCAVCHTGLVSAVYHLTRFGRVRERPGPALLQETEGGRPCPTAPIQCRAPL
jgi:hypothetical protein